MPLSKTQVIKWKWGFLPEKRPLECFVCAKKNTAAWPCHSPLEDEWFHHLKLLRKSGSKIKSVYQRVTHSCWSKHRSFEAYLKVNRTINETPAFLDGPIGVIEWDIPKSPWLFNTNMMIYFGWFGGIHSRIRRFLYHDFHKPNCQT